MKPHNQNNGTLKMRIHKPANTPLERLSTLSHELYDWILDHTRFSIRFKITLLIPLLLWLVLFQFCKYIPPSDRPDIDTESLPIGEGLILFGHSLQHWPRNSIPNTREGSIFKSFLDLLAAFVYIIHFGFSWVFALGLYLYYRKKTTKLGEPIIQPWTYLWCLGICNFLAVATQLAWPTAPPWYVEVYGNSPASYSMSGDPAGLGRADLMLKFPLFSTLYGQSPIVFGSFPSLHAAWPLMITLFAPQFKVLKVMGLIYTGLVWWAAMYLNHHFFIDVLGGGLYVIVSYFVGIYSVEFLKKVFKEKMYSRGSYHFMKMAREDFELKFLEDGIYEEELSNNNIKLKVVDDV